jgi:magnesium-transporting ATPase (P-type)
LFSELKVFFLLFFFDRMSLNLKAKILMLESGRAGPGDRSWARDETDDVFFADCVESTTPLGLLPPTNQNSSMYNNNSTNHQDKPLYIGLTPIKSSSPPPQPIGTPPTTDEGFAYSTLLRRAEDETLLRTSHHHHHHRLPSPTTSTFPHQKAHPTTQDDPQNPSSSSFYASATPSAHYSVQSIDEVVQQFNTHPVKGLLSQSVPAIRGIHGPNEFQVDAKESVLKKFLAQFYESPLNLLLLGSAAVSYIVGNTDDAISITAAIVIVVTGMKNIILIFQAKK